MSGPNPYAQYQRTSIETASPTKLVVLLYDGAIRFLTRLVPVMEAKNYYEQSMYINKTQAIIAHLYGTLDFEKGGSVALALEKAYINMYDTLTAANIKDDPERVRKVLEALRDLREAWVEVDRQVSAAQAVKIANEQGREFAIAA
jgi:flagellar protein FliS